MTRQHFEAIAEALRSEKPADNWCPNKHVQWALDCKSIAFALSRFNGRFDRDRFLRACGMEG